MKQPRVSVIVPAFNAEAYISNAINSILGQTAFADELEILIVDDRSTDNTRQVVADLNAAYPQVKLLINERSRGPSGARNTGLLQARGEYIAFLDADDLWHDDHLAKGIPFLE